MIHFGPIHIDTYFDIKDVNIVFSFTVAVILCRQCLVSAARLDTCSARLTSIAME